jgi:tRNA threonylcarbamoyladenosine biosynthesis protein TsaE
MGLPWGDGAAHLAMKDATIIEALQRYLPDAESTLRTGASLAPGLRGGMIVTLSGELGAGKTTLVRGILRELGWADAVKSPSYALVEHYPISSLYFYHFDLYRFNDSSEWDSSGFAEYFRPDAICVIEWPERIAGRLPTVDVAAVLTHAAPGRTLMLQAATQAGKACLAGYSAAIA